MFEGSGSTLKLLAKISFVIGTAASMIAGFIILLSSEIGWLVFFLGPVASFFSVLPMYTLGEVHEQNREIKRLLSGTDSFFGKKSEPATLEPEHTDIKEETPKHTVSHNIDGTWNCSCGRNNQNYISTCVCGTSRWHTSEK